MKKIIGKNGSGKTQELIKLSAETGNVIVCFSESSEKLKSKAKSLFGLTIPDPISHSDFISKNYDEDSINGFLIDDVDMLMRQLTDVPIKGITLTKNSE